jgi:hypothetical protein
LPHAAAFLNHCIAGSLLIEGTGAAQQLRICQFPLRVAAGVAG